MRIMRYILCTIALALVFSGFVQGADLPQDGPELAAEAAFLTDVSTGKVLYEKNPDQPLFPASTTKIITALLLLEYAELDEVVTVGEEIKRIGPNSSTAKLKVGNKLTVAELVYAIMLPSGNDAAYTAAVYTARKASGIEQMGISEALTVFAELMNSRARELGAANTNFVVPDGYHDPDHISTARDLAMITLEARNNQFLREAVATTEYHWQGVRWFNTNMLLHSEFPNAYFPWATGFKTGYTGNAGHCLVATASGGGREILAVLLNSTKDQRWPEARNLLEYGFDSWQNYAMLVEGRQIFMVPVNGQRRGEPEYMEILAGGTFSDLFHVDQIPRLELTYNWEEDAVGGGDGLTLRAPIKKGEILGLAVISLDGIVLAEVSMVAAYDVKSYNWLLLAGASAVLFLLLLLIIPRRRKTGMHSARRRKWEAGKHAAKQRY